MQLLAGWRGDGEIHTTHGDSMHFPVLGDFLPYFLLPVQRDVLIMCNYDSKL